jgi:hydrogenase maturation factor
MLVIGPPAAGLATCRGEDGVRTTVDVSLVGQVGAGDVVLVHAGVALARMTPGPGAAGDRP